MITTYQKSAIKVLNVKKISGVSDILLILLEAFPNLSSAVSGVATAFKSGAGAMSVFKAAGSGLKNIITSPPYVTLAVAIIAVVKAVDYFTDSLDELEEKLSESQGELSEIQTELTSLENELTTISDKIAEINSQDNLSITDSKELEKLEKESAEIQRQIDLLKLKESVKQDEVYDTFVDTMNKDLNNNTEYSMFSDGSIADINILFGSLAGAIGGVNEQDYINAQIKTYQENLDKIAELNSRYANDLLNPEYTTALNQFENQNKEIAEYLVGKSDEFAERLGSLSYIEKPINDAQREVNEMINLIGDFDDRMAILLGSNNAETNAFNRLVTTEFSDVTSSLQELGEQGQVTAEDLQEDKYDEFIDKLIYLGVISADTDDELKYLAEMFNGVAESAGKVAETTGDIDIPSFTDKISGVESLSTGLDQLKEIYLDVKDKGDFDYSSILNNKDFKTSFGDLGESYDNFIKTITESPDDISACQSAFNGLVAEYINTSGVLNDLTTETRDASVALLEQMGVANAATVVDETLEAKEKGLLVTTTDLTTATWDEIYALYNEAEAGSVAQTALAQYLLEKYNINDNPIDTTEDIEQLIALANAAGASTTRLAATKAALDAINSEAESDDTGRFGTSRKDINKTEVANNNVQSAIKDLLKNLDYTKLNAEDYIVNPNNYTFTPSSTESSNSGSGEQDNKPIDKFNKSVSKFFDWIEIKLDRLQTKTEKYFHKAEKLLEDGKFSSARNQYENAADATSKQIKANQKAKKEYKNTANEVLQKAVSTGVISKKQAKSIKSKVKDGTIDISKYSDDVQTVIESYKDYYDKSVESGNNVDDLLEQYEEYIEKRYNIPIERAAESIEELEDDLSDLEAKLDIKKTAKGKNNILDDITENAKAQYDTYNEEAQNAKYSLNKIWKSKSLKSALKTKSNKGKKKGDELSTKGLDKNSKAYKAVIKYNAALKAKTEAVENASDAEIEYTKTLRENTKARFDNISAEYKSKQSQNEANLSFIETKIDSLYSTGKSKVTSEATQLYNSAIAENKSLISSYESELKALRDEYNKNSSNMSDEDRRDALNEIKSVEEDILKSQINIEKYQAEIAELPFAELEKQLELLEAIESKISSEVSLKEAKGLDLSEYDYTNQIANNILEIDNKRQSQNEAYKNYLSALASPNKAFGGKSSDEWLAEYNKYASEINNIKTENENLKDSLRDDVYWRTFERAHESAKRFSDVLNGISELISDNMLFDSDGNLTDFGISKLSLDIKQVEKAREEVENYSADIQNLNKLYRDGLYTEEEYKEKLSELQVELLNSAGSMKTYLDGIIDLYKDAAQAELDALFELIDARNKALSAKKEYYDYDKTIRSKTKDIQALQTQIAALEGINDTEAKAKKAQLSADLAEAQEDLDDTINEHKLEISQESLTDMKDILQETFDDKFTDIFSDLDGIQEILSSANSLVDSRTAEINDNLSKLLDHYGINVEDLETNTETKVSDSGVVNPYDSAVNQINKVANGVASLMASLFSTEKAYASGTKYVPRKMRALTNEKGDEIIVTKDGLITPLEQGDGVVPSELTKRLYELASAELKIIPPSDMVNNEIYPELAKRFSASELQIAPTVNVQKFKAPNINTNIAPNITQHYDNLINIEGSADATTVADLKKMSKNIIAESYEYTTKKLYEDYIRSGGKRRI